MLNNYPQLKKTLHYLLLAGPVTLGNYVTTGSDFDKKEWVKVNKK